MNKKDIFIGTLLGLLVSSIGFIVLVYLLTAIKNFEDLKLLYGSGYLGKFITLGSIPNLILFFFLIKKGKDYMARGVIIATVLLAIFTFISQF